MITLILIGLVGGLITGISPCVLPVLPVIFLSGGVNNSAAGFQQTGAGVATATKVEPATTARSRRPYLIVAGLALSFSVFTLLGTLVLSALPVPKDIIRVAGLIALVLLGIAMMFPKVQELLERPFARIGQRQVRGDRGGFVLGLALGAVYVPCAGPVLTAITVAGASGEIGLRTVGLTVAFAVGTAIPLLIFALAGRGVAARVRAFRERQRGVRIVAGLVVIALAVALSFNVTDVLQRSVPDYTASLNKTLGSSGGLGPAQSAQLQTCAEQADSVPQNCGKAPAINGIQQWLNTPGGAPANLKGKVTLVDFWAYSCINCQRAIPQVQAWYSTYQRAGFTVVGVHTPEYAFEHVPANVAAGAKRLHMTYPIALDNDYTTWNAFANQSWPAEYLIDATGQIRHVAIGEGEYETTESLIRQLLTEAHPGIALPQGTQVPDNTPKNANLTPESYLGSDRADNIVNSSSNGTHDFTTQTPPNGNIALGGTWDVADEKLTAVKNSTMALNFTASNVYLDVGGTGTVTATMNGKSSTYRISGAPNIYPVVHGTDLRRGTVSLSLSPGLQAYSFTFG